MSDRPDVAAALVALFDLRGRFAVVIGGATGMGRAAAAALASVGAKVIVADDPAKTAGLAAAEATAVDVTSEASVASLFAKIDDRYGRLDILVNAATLIHNRPMLEIDLAEWDRVQAVNLRSAFLTIRAAIPLIRRAGGGRIVNLTTIGGRHPVLNGNAAYSSAKAGLNMLTLNCALDFAADGITVNAILPGAIITEGMASGVKRTGPGADPVRHLFGYGKPEDIVGALLLLTGPAGRYITGQQIAVDGGFLLT